MRSRAEAAQASVFLMGGLKIHRLSTGSCAPIVGAWTKTAIRLPRQPARHSTRSRWRPGVTARARWQGSPSLPQAQCEPSFAAVSLHAMEECAMRNQFETKFWQKAYDSLSPATRVRYGWEMRSAE